ncbi:MAG: hypothetical protein K5910_08005, partial [Bacteroidales bacterium]|nr:hypothetical protein [Bacteroidales bacterium]
MRRLLASILCFVLLSAVSPLGAQMAVRSDSSAFHPRELIAPGVLLGTGTLIHCFGHDAIDVPINTWTQEQWRQGRPER